MKISYNWLNDFLPFQLAPEKLSVTLTSLGLEVESMQKFESVKGSLEGVVIGKVLHTEQHPNADKLKVTKVDVGNGRMLSIVCGAPNVAAGQTVAVATIGATLHSFSGEEITLKPAKIRGEKSEGMICAEDELGLGQNHEGIMILPDEWIAGQPAARYFDIYEDVVFEIGLTPNRTDAMSHYGVARDLVAHYNYHHNTSLSLKNPFKAAHAETGEMPLKINITDAETCSRYCGVVLSGLEVKPSPKWLQQRLSAIGVRPVNNIVDATNYVLQALGQPLHAFDFDAIKGGEIRIGRASAGDTFITLDDKERKLTGDEIMISDAANSLCMAGIFGGAASGVKEHTTSIFLESAVFSPTLIRKASLQHNLRTEAAIRFEKQVDVSNALNALKAAAALITAIAGGRISSAFADVYPSPPSKTVIDLKIEYVHRLSGKNYSAEEIKTILQLLGFSVEHESEKCLYIGVPAHKTDVTIAADLVEEIIRIDGLENIFLPGNMNVSPQISRFSTKEKVKEKIALLLSGSRLMEIVTNSITNSNYYSGEQLSTAVKMINNLSSELDILKPSMLESGLEVIAYNLNRKNYNLQLFEFGKVYAHGVNGYTETEQLAIYLTGNLREKGWAEEAKAADFFYAKGLAGAVLTAVGFKNISVSEDGKFQLIADKQTVGSIAMVDAAKRKQFDIKQPVCHIVMDVAVLEQKAAELGIRYKEVSRFPTVERDLAILVDRNVTYAQIKAAADTGKIARLKKIRLFDIFESEKIGADKKSIALNFSFLDEEKTLTDKEVDGMMQKLMRNFETQLKAEIRKS